MSLSLQAGGATNYYRPSMAEGVVHHEGPKNGMVSFASSSLRTLRGSGILHGESLVPYPSKRAVEQLLHYFSEIESDYLPVIVYTRVRP